MGYIEGLIYIAVSEAKKELAEWEKKN
jgi:hypothetical protein